MAPQNHPSVIALRDFKERWRTEKAKIWADERFTQQHRTGEIELLKAQYRDQAIGIVKTAVAQARKQQAAALKRFQEGSQSARWDYNRLAFVEREIGATLATATNGVFGQNALQMAQQLRASYQQAGDKHALRALRVAFAPLAPALRKQEGVGTQVGDFLRELEADAAAELPEEAREAMQEAEQARALEREVGEALASLEREIDITAYRESVTSSGMPSWFQDAGLAKVPPAIAAGGVVFMDRSL